MSEEDDKTCLRRAITAALCFAGRDEDASWIPAYATSEILPEICERYGVEWIGRNAPCDYDPGNRPVVVLYDTDTGETNGKLHGHAVFCSDVHPFKRWTVYHLLLGWERRE